MLLLASSDLNHYEPAAVSEQKDARALEATKADLAPGLMAARGIATSALTGDGLPALRLAIAGRLRSLAVEGPFCVPLFPGV